MTTATLTAATPDNLAIGWLIDQRSGATLSPRQRALAIATEDRRDTFGRKRFERVNRVALIAGEHDRATSCDPVADLSPIVLQLVDTMRSAGLDALIPGLMAGLTVSQAARECGIPERTARHKIAEIRSALAEFVAAV